MGTFECHCTDTWTGDNCTNAGEFSKINNASTNYHFSVTCDEISTMNLATGNTSMIDDSGNANYTVGSTFQHYCIDGAFIVG